MDRKSKTQGTFLKEKKKHKRPPGLLLYILKEKKIVRALEFISLLKEKKTVRALQSVSPLKEKKTVGAPEIVSHH